MGAIMCMGVANLQHILVVSFATEKMMEGSDSISAALEQVSPFSPVLMTALAMIIGMVPMALGLGDGGEQNAPLGRGGHRWTDFRDGFDPVIRSGIFQAFCKVQTGMRRKRNRRTRANPCELFMLPQTEAIRRIDETPHCRDVRVKRSRKRWLGLAICRDRHCRLLVSGIWSRVRARATLDAQTARMALPSVGLFHPKQTAPAEEIILPRNVQPFITSPIYFTHKWVS